MSGIYFDLLGLNAEKRGRRLFFGKRKNRYIGWKWSLPPFRWGQILKGETQLKPLRTIMIIIISIVINSIITYRVLQLCSRGKHSLAEWCRINGLMSVHFRCCLRLLICSNLGKFPKTVCGGKLRRRGWLLISSNVITLNELTWKGYYIVKWYVCGNLCFCTFHKT